MDHRGRWWDEAGNAPTARIQGRSLQGGNTPEPATFVLLGAGAALARLRRRRRAAGPDVSPLAPAPRPAVAGRDASSQDPALPLLICAICG